MIPLVLFTAHSRSRSRRVFSSSSFIPRSLLFLLAARKSDMFHLRSLSRRSCRARAISRRIDPRYPFFPFGRQPAVSARVPREREGERDPREAVLLLRRINLRYFRPLLPFGRVSAALRTLVPSAHTCRLTWFRIRDLRLVSSSALRAMYATYIVTNCNDHAELVEARKRGKKKERDGNDFLSLGVDASN